jgi:hypothetical protein
MLRQFAGDVTCPCNSHHFIVPQPEAVMSAFEIRGARPSKLKESV